MVVPIRFIDCKHFSFHPDDKVSTNLEHILAGQFTCMSLSFSPSSFFSIETELKFGEPSVIAFQAVSGMGSPVCQRRGGNTILINV